VHFDQTVYEMDSVQNLNPQTTPLKPIVNRDNSSSSSINSLNVDHSWLAVELYKSGSESPKSKWDRLCFNFFQACHRVMHSVISQSKSSLIFKTSQLVEQLRILFNVFGLGDSSSSAFQFHKALPLIHHHILIELSEVVLWSHVCSGIWPPPDGWSLLREHLMNLIAWGRHFANLYQDSVHELKISTANAEQSSSISDVNTTSNAPGRVQNNPFLVSYSSSRGTSQLHSRRGSQDSHRPPMLDPQWDDRPNLLEKFSNASWSAGIALDCLIEQIDEGDGFTPQIVSLVKQVVCDVGTILALFDQLNIESASQEVQQMAVSYKTTSYNLCHQLVQMTVTEPLNLGKPVEELIDIADELNSSIKDLMVSVKFITEESHIKDLMQLQEKIAIFKKTLPTISPETPEITLPILRKSVSLNNLGSGAFKNAMMNRVVSTPASNTYIKPSDDIETASIRETTRTRTINKGTRGDKLKQFFGDSFMPDDPSGGNRKASVSSNTSSPSVPKAPYLGPDYAPEDVIFNNTGPTPTVKAGTLKSLIQILTAHDGGDPQYMSTFLLTYRSFTTTPQLLEFLSQRFNLEPPSNLKPIQVEEWTEKKLTPIRMRVVIILKTWLETYYMDHEDCGLLEWLREFALFVIKEALPFATDQLIKLIDKRIESADPELRRMVPNLSADLPSSYIPKAYDGVLDINPTEIARQFTLMEFQMFSQIKPVECLNKAWSSQNKNSEKIFCPNIRGMIEHFNQLTSWVAFTILSESDISHRASVYKHYILIAERCYELNNFNALTAILAGLNSAPIHRLKRTLESLSHKSIETMSRLKRVMESGKNFSLYREHLHKANPPCVPFLGMYLTDLTFIEDGNSDILPDTNLINFSKRSKTAAVIREIQQFQNVNYQLRPLPPLQAMLQKRLSSTYDAHTMYARSLKLEPRESAEQKVARILSETGFF
jgi:son of sevenless-like protein